MEMASGVRNRGERRWRREGVLSDSLAEIRPNVRTWLPSRLHRRFVVSAPIRQAGPHTRLITAANSEVLFLGHAAGLPTVESRQIRDKGFGLACRLVGLR